MPAVIEQKFDDKTDLSKIPADAFNFICQAEFAAAEDDDKKNNRLKLQFYDGQVNYHWYWGNFAFDMGSIKLSRKKVGILDSHDTSKRVGIGTELSVDKVAVLTGEFLDNDVANEIKKDGAAGFPFQASMSFEYARAKIEYIKEGQSVQVNGHTLTGPGTYISNTFVREVSVCAFGAVENCSTEVFKQSNNKNNIGKDFEMADKKEIETTIESFQVEHSEIYKDVFAQGKADGEKVERDAFKEIKEVCGKDNLEIAVQCYEESKTVVDALKMCNEKLALANTELKKNPPAKPGKVIDPADAEFSDKQKELKPDADADVMTLTEDQLKAKFEATKELQEEFSSFKSYLGFVKYEKQSKK